MGAGQRVSVLSAASRVFLPAVDSIDLPGLLQAALALEARLILAGWAVRRCPSSQVLARGPT